MVKIITSTMLDQNLVIEALNNHGFKCVSHVYKKWRLFGKSLYVIEVEFVPGILFLEMLLGKALEIEDYWNAQGIQKMIDIRKGTK